MAVMSIVDGRVDRHPLAYLVTLDVFADFDNRCADFVAHDLRQAAAGVAIDCFRWVGG